MPAMYLAGLPIPGPDVLELARLVDDQALAEARDRLRERRPHPSACSTGGFHRSRAETVDRARPPVRDSRV